RARCALASLRRSRRSCRGLVIFSPVESVTKALILASTPTEDSTGGSGRTFSSTRMDTHHRPAASLLTVTVDGCAPSGRGRDHTMRKGSRIFARNSRPSFQRNALRVYSADARERLRDLNLGYFARLAKKFANAACRCRNACWSGTEDTSLRNASSSVRFHWVSIAEVST